MKSELPVVVIGAGPVGLAAAAELAERGLPFQVLEAGERVGSNVRQWGHVRMFSPWEYDVSPIAQKLLEEIGWEAPPRDEMPTGRDVVERLLEPLAAHPRLRDAIRFGARVESVSRVDHDALRDGKGGSRERAPFLVRVKTAAGEEDLRAKAVIDASGTWQNPNPMGASGVPARGEPEARSASITTYGMPDVLGADRGRYAGQRVLVIGGGHSAQGVIQDLVALRREAPSTKVIWAVRAANLSRVFGGGEKDQLPGRGLLGLAVKKLVESGGVEVVTSFSAAAVRRVESGDGWIVSSNDRDLEAVDRIVVATGFRPDWSLERELRLAIDPATEAPAKLAPLIDPNVHSCGTVPPHGEAELRHPESDVYVVGMKSYGRAPTFLLRTGYEQVRSIVAALAGDTAAARRVELVLPETGVCSVPKPLRALAPLLPAVQALAGCCGGPAKSEAACCVADEQAKSAGKEGCGCS